MRPRLLGLGCLTGFTSGDGGQSNNRGPCAPGPALRRSHAEPGTSVASERASRRRPLDRGSASSLRVDSTEGTWWAPSQSRKPRSRRRPPRAPRIQPSHPPSKIHHAMTITAERVPAYDTPKRRCSIRSQALLAASGRTISALMSSAHAIPRRAQYPISDQLSRPPAEARSVNRTHGPAPPSAHLPAITTANAG